MNDLTLMRSFRAERVKQDPAVRAAARRALEARFELATAGAPALAAPAPRRRLFSRNRRRFLAFASATALAAALAGAVVLSSGPTAQPAAAEVLRETAAVAAAADGPTPVPDPGQFLYMKTKRVELQEWVPGEYTASGGGLIPDTSTPQGRELSRKEPFTAFVPWQEEEWMSRNEPSRSRWVMGTPRFLSSAERSRWVRAGSPLPSPFGGRKEARGFPGGHVVEARRGVMDVETISGHGFRDFSSLPREPKALRLAIERRQPAGKPLDDGQVIAELWDILDKPNGTPALRAAVFGALAEEPGMDLDRDASDLIGRPGYAVSYENQRASDYQQAGIRVEYIFDPETSELLGRREVVADPRQVFPAKDRQLFPWQQGIEAGTVRREVAYLQAGIVDSARERPHGRSEPVATTDPR
jgi:hypothetical protein